MLAYLDSVHRYADVYEMDGQAGWLTTALLFSLWSYRSFASLPLGDPRLSGVNNRVV